MDARSSVQASLEANRQIGHQPPGVFLADARSRPVCEKDHCYQGLAPFS